MAEFVKVLGWALLAGGVLLIVLGLVGIGMKDGLWAAIETLNPFNIANFVMTVITLAPGILLLAWGDMLSRKKQGRE